MCNVPLAVVSELDPGNTRLCALALEVKERYTNVFKLYSACHMLFNSSKSVDTILLGALICYYVTPHKFKSFSLCHLVGFHEACLI